jgi:hypothetical protein
MISEQVESENYLRQRNRGRMSTVRMLVASSGGVNLADAAATFLNAISVTNTRRSYSAALQPVGGHFGADTTVAAMDPDRVAVWVTSVWGSRWAKTFSTAPTPPRARLQSVCKLTACQDRCLLVKDRRIWGT